MWINPCIKVEFYDDNDELVFTGQQTIDMEEYNEVYDEDVFFGRLALYLLNCKYYYRIHDTHIRKVVFYFDGRVIEEEDLYWNGEEYLFI